MGAGWGLHAQQRSEVTADVAALERGWPATPAPGYLCSSKAETRAAELVRSRAFIIILGDVYFCFLFFFPTEALCLSANGHTHTRLRVWPYEETLADVVANSRCTLIYWAHEMTPLKLFVALERERV